MRAAGLLLMLAPAAAAAGCARESAERICPDLAPGELVITEIRGLQMPKQKDDDAAPWVEIYNASDRSIDLLGIQLAFRQATGVPAGTALVRRGLSIAPGAYAVFGLFGDVDLPPTVDYGSSLNATWEDHGDVTVLSCDEPIDYVQYTAPALGTYSLIGEPDAERNDYTASWCTADKTQVGTIYPGSPGRPNQCP